MQTNTEQGTLDWHRQRLGKITSSRAGVLFQKSTNKDKDFGDKANAYLSTLVTDRLLKQAIIDDDEQFGIYLGRKFKSSADMRWGTEFEELAKEQLAKLVGQDITNVGYRPINDFCGDSSDGVIFAGDVPLITAELKCPTPDKHVWYIENINTGEDLLKIPNNNKEYYTQCQLHNEAWGTEVCLWGSFDYMCKKQLHSVEVKRDPIFIEQWLERAELANNHINKRVEIILNLQNF